MLKQIFRDFIPPIFFRIYQRSVKKSGFFGNYQSWEEAKKLSSGYDSDVILNKVKDAILKVKSGETVYERDSVQFDKIHYSWPLLVGLLWIASQNRNKLNLIDFGGSLGSSYYQNKKFLLHLDELRWNIVEQKKFVECGKRYFEGKHLKFYFRLDDCLKVQHADTILLSSVIQYLEKPYELLKEIIENKFKYILFDRTPFLDNGKDRITIQKVPAEIYRASYPSWFFNLSKFLRFFSEEYELVAEFDALAGTIYIEGGCAAYDKGFIFKRRPRE